MEQKEANERSFDEQLHEASRNLDVAQIKSILEMGWPAKDLTRTVVDDVRYSGFDEKKLADVLNLLMEYGADPNYK